MLWFSKRRVGDTGQTPVPGDTKTVDGFLFQYQVITMPAGFIRRSWVPVDQHQADRYILDLRSKRALYAANGWGEYK